MKSFAPTRRTFLKAGTAATALIGLGPSVLRQAAAQEADLAPYKSAKINWRQAEGESITVAVIPASYFENLISLAPQFEALTGIKVRFEKVPPGQIRQKACSTCRRRPAPTRPTRPTRCTTRCTSPTSGSSRSTTTSTTHADRPRLVQVRRHHQGLARRRLGRRQALRHSVRRRSHGAGLPQGPVRRQGPEAGRRPTTTCVANAKALNDPDDRI